MATTIGFQKKVKNKLKNKEENNNDESLVCDVCSVVCKSTANLRKHQQRTHDDREYTCDTCGIKVTGLHKFKSHKRRHETFSCPNCNKDILLPNKAKHLKVCGIHECDKCDHKTTTKDKLAHHMKTHDRKVCEICGYQARNLVILDIHRQKKHVPSTKINRPKEMFNCNWCTYSSSKHSNVTTHQNKFCPVRKREQPLQTEPVTKANLSDLFANTNCNITDFNKILRFFSNKFGSEWFEKKAGEAVSEFCNSMNILHSSDSVKCVDKDGNLDAPRSIHYVSDVLSLIDKIKEELEDGSPEIVISADSGMGKVRNVLKYFIRHLKWNLNVSKMFQIVGTLL